MNKENLLLANRPKLNNNKLIFPSARSTPIRSMKQLKVPTKEDIKLNNIRPKSINRRILYSRNELVMRTVRNSKRQPFILDGWKVNQQHLPIYNGLEDKCLIGFFDNPRMRRHLISMRLVIYI